MQSGGFLPLLLLTIPKVRQGIASGVTNLAVNAAKCVAVNIASKAPNALAKKYL